MKHLRLLGGAFAALFYCLPVSAQTAGTVTNHAFALGKGAGHSGYTSLLCGSAQLAVGQPSADPICKTITGDVTLSAAGALSIGATKVTSAMLNADVFSTAHTWAGQQTFVAPALGTPASGTLTNATGLPVASGISGLGTGVATALGVNVGTAGAPIVNGGALGTPTSGVATNLTGTASGLTAGNVTTNANLTGDVTSVGNATTIGANKVTNAMRATMAAYTLKGNATGSTANEADIDVTALTSKASPVSTDIVLIQDSAASNAFKKTTVGALASAGSVASLNSLTGALAIAPGGGIGVSASSPNITVSLRAATVKQLSGSGTYTSPSGSSYVLVQMCGGGGGGSGSGTGATMGNGSSGGSATFDTMTAGGGGGGQNAGGGTPGAGGTLSVTSPDIGWTGASGQGPYTGVTGMFLPRIAGGGSALWNGSAAGTPVAGTGAGGSTGQMNGAGNSGGSGGSGACAIGVRAGGGASYSYSVGSGGGGGTAGTSGGAGIAGAAGTILVFEF